MNAAMKHPNDFLVKDLALADWGRKEIKIAETEMPGLMAIRHEFAAQQPLRGARITGSRHMTLRRAGCPGALGLVQYLFDPGSCSGRHCRRGYPGVCGEGRIARRVLGLHASHFRMARRRTFEHDFGRWR